MPLTPGYPKLPFDNRYYYTRRLPLAAYLLAHRMMLVNVDHDSYGLEVFVFRDAPDRDLLVHEFRYGPEALVDARQYALAMSQLQLRLEHAQSEYPTLSYDL